MRLPCAPISGVVAVVAPAAVIVQVTFDHKARTLNIMVQKDNRDCMSQIENVKLLSGGERSYATLSLLIALGDSLECPFRVMDEFDVFMDQVSRKVRARLLSK